MRATCRVSPGRAQRRLSAAERSDGPCGTAPCAPAEERSAMGCAGNLALQHLTHCACPSVVNAVNGASCAMQPMARAPQVAWSEAEGQGHRGRLLLLTFLGEARKVSPGVGWIAPPPHLDQTYFSIEPTASEQAPGTGICPRQCSHFLLLRQEKVTKEKAAPVPTSLRWRSGQPAVLAAWAHCTTRTTHCVRSARTSAMSQFTKREVPRAAQATALLGVGTGGTPTRAIAALGLGFGPSLRSATARAPGD
ncbi:hypothetical protein DES41_10611 [Pseudorhodoferax soli]|uniref:Uncharacterized protein n=1 Tax=Pseudorhodoferax soli TaxID=545864 RepID=A0A368XME5_9BURK|nr:hypothetical protein DES41_10611 [Pseudorhodoferax soli]